MNRTVLETYIMYLKHNWKMHELVVSKPTGAVFAEKLIGKTTGDFTSVQRHFYNIYEHGWFTDKELETIHKTRIGSNPAG